MARTAAGAALTEQHRSAQIAIRAGALRDFVRLWPLWTGDQGSFRTLIEATVPLVEHHHGLSSALASAYYEAFRRSEDPGGTPAVRVAEAVDRDKVAAGLVVTGQQTARAAIAGGFSPQAAMQQALVGASGSVTRQVLGGGRSALVQSATADAQAQGWTRVTGGDPCAFCAMLASRGPSYSEQGADFEAHDHCTCFAEPTYDGAEWPGRAREFQALYQEHAKGTSDPLNNFRRALEGRVQ